VTLKEKRFCLSQINFRVFSPTTGGISGYGCEGADFHDLK
jgi:hypothetical protein